MLDMVQAINSRGDLLSLVLDDVADGLALTEVGGLGPVKATIVSTSYARLDGSQFHTAKRESRNMTLKINLEPDYIETYPSDLRTRLYNYFMTKTWVKLTLSDDNDLQVEIEGHVESCEPDIFTQEPVINVSIINDDPDFLGPSVHVAGVSTSLDDVVQIPYVGTVETGITFNLMPDRDLTEFTIYMESPDGSLSQLNYAGDLDAGDILTISTVPGNKYVQLNRGGVFTSALNGVDPTSKWIDLNPGTNKIRVYAIGASIPWTLDYTTRYGGL